jgi:hypothetical protein
MSFSKLTGIGVIVLAACQPAMQTRPNSEIAVPPQTAELKTDIWSPQILGLEPLSEEEIGTQCNVTANDIYRIYHTGKNAEPTKTKLEKLQEDNEAAANACAVETILCLTKYDPTITACTTEGKKAALSLIQQAECRKAAIVCIEKKEQEDSK